MTSISRDYSLTVEKWIDISTNLLKDGYKVKVHFTVNGDSMFPLIRKGIDVVTLLPVFRTLKVGDIVLFKARRLGGDYVLHRIIEISGSTVLTRGDNCLRPDEWLNQYDILGIAVSIQRGSRKINCEAGVYRGLLFIWVLILPCIRYMIKFRKLMHISKPR